MKSRFHKITALLIAAAMLVAMLAACGEEAVNLQEVYKFSETAVNLNAGENYALLIYDDTYSDRQYSTVWSSDNPSVVSVEQSGFITALSAGQATVTANLHFEKEKQDVTLNCAITVLETNIAVTGVSINAMEQTLDVGGVTVLTATILPADASNKAVSWTTSDPTVAIVSSGVVTAVGAGTAIVTAVTDDGAKTADCIITVNTPVDVFESLTLNRSSVSVAVGKSSSLIATIKPEGIAADIIWTSADETIATVQNGTITGLKAGTTTITATLNDKVTNKVATCKVTVTSSTSSTSSGNSGSSSGNSGSSSGNSGSTTTPSTVRATKVEFDVQSITVYVGQTGPWKFNPTVTPSNTTEKGTWRSSDPTVAAVDENGNITIGNIGSNYFATATITYTVGSKSANGVVVVMAESANPNPGTSQTPGTETPGTETPGTETPGTETPGTETPGTETPGQTTEQPADNGQRITSIILAEDDAEVYLGTPYKLEFDAYPKAYAASETYTWTSSNESIATVDSDGVVTGVAVGETTVTIKGSKSGITASCKVTVKLKEAESISLSHAAVTLNIGTTATLIATVTPADASETITWSSNFPNIVSVNPIDSRSAVIASLADGTATITARTSSGKTATCSVASGITGYDTSGQTTITTPSTIKVSVVVSSNGDLIQGEGYSAYLTFSPALTSAQQSTMMYSISPSNGNVAVSRATPNDYTKNSFTITPTVETGTATLTGFVSSSDTSLKFEYVPKTVSILSPSINIKTPIKTLTMNPTSVALFTGDSKLIAVSATPTVNDDSVTWMSSDENVVRVTGSGLTATVVAVAPGRATVTARTQGNLTTSKVTAACTVTVNSTGSVDQNRGTIGVMQGSTYVPTNADIGASGQFLNGLAPTWTENSVVSSSASGQWDTSYVMKIASNGTITVGENVAVGTSMTTQVTYALAGTSQLIRKDFTIMVMNSKQTTGSTTATARLSATVGDKGNLRSLYGGDTFETSFTNVVRVNANGDWEAVGPGTADVHVYTVSGTVRTEILTVQITVGNPVKTYTMVPEQSVKITDILGTTTSIAGATSANPARASVSTLNNEFIITANATSSTPTRITVNLQDGSIVYIDVTVQSSSSSGSSTSSSNPRLTASSTNVRGGNSVTVTLSNATAFSYNWSITSDSGETIATFENGKTEYETIATNTSSSLTIKTNVVSENQKITVHVAGYNNIEIASLEITVSK
ncbi:MAG: Ig-like domain-containing protein [Clostridia bacterium]|nr:Ig-like domain-containing protein [Clostridia bacterium]